jgi:predicted nucleic acid-binding protein
LRHILDTNVVSELRKSNSNAGLLSWFRGVSGDDLFLSALTIGEVRQGIERLRRRDPSRAEAIDEWLRGLRQDYADRILPITPEIADEWGRLGVPDLVPAVDGLIAATARVHGLTLVTRNTADFARMGVALLNPFS